MVRVVNANKEQSPRQKELQRLLILAIEERASSFLALLSRFNMLVKNGADKKEIRDRVMYMISKRNVRFNDALSELLGEYVERQSKESAYEEENFDLSSLGGIADKLVSLGGSKKVREENKGAAVGKILDMKSQQSQNAENAKKKKSGQQIWMAVGILTSILIIGGVIVYSVRKTEVAPAAI